MTGTNPCASITRRTLLLAGAGAAASVAIPEVAKGASKQFLAKTKPYLLRSTWEQLVGRKLNVATGWGSVGVRLVAVEDIPNLSGQTADFRERSFVLRFSGGPVEAAIYRFKHKLIGKPKLAVTSGDPDGDGFSVVLSNAKLRRKRKRLGVQKAKKHRETRKDRRAARKHSRKPAPKAPEPKAAPAPEPPPKSAAPADGTTYESLN